jgi:hypothetical protein
MRGKSLPCFFGNHDPPVQRGHRSDPARAIALLQERKIQHHLLYLWSEVTLWRTPEEDLPQSTHRGCHRVLVTAFPLFMCHLERFKSELEDLKGRDLQRLQIQNEPLLSLAPVILTGHPTGNSAVNGSPRYQSGTLRWRTRFLSPRFRADSYSSMFPSRRSPPASGRLLVPEAPFSREGEPFRVNLDHRRQSEKRDATLW